jgi:putative NADH-flavin reductase
MDEVRGSIPLGSTRHMKVILFGATGGTGRHVLTKALEAGHEVVAVVRKPDGVSTKHDRLRVVAGDVLDASTLTAPMSGGDAIISTIGPANNKKPGTMLSQGIQNLVAAATAANVKRFVFESGLMMTDGHDLSLVSRIGVSIYRRLNYALYSDKKLAEAAVVASDLDWVLVRPPALVHEPGTGKYIAGVHARVSAASTLSHEDAAACLVRAVSEADWVRKIVNVGH